MKSFMRFGVATLLLSAMAGSVSAGDEDDAYWQMRRMERAVKSAQMDAEMNAAYQRSAIQRQSRYIQQNQPPYNPYYQPYQYQYQPMRTYSVQRWPNNAGYWVWGW